MGQGRNTSRKPMTAKEYNALVDEYADGLYRFAHGYLKDPFEAENVVQNTLEKLWVKREQVRMESVKAFLYKVAYNNCIDLLRVANRQTGLEAVEHRAGGGAGYSDARKIIQQAADKLPEKQKVALLLRDYEGYDYRSIGEITGMTEAQVKINIFRARKQMKAIIKDIHTVI